MQKILFIVFVFTTVVFISKPVLAQEKKDSTIQKKQDSVIVKVDTALKQEIKKFNPRTATIRSAILPGWGQAYNKKYWKIPLVYAALGVTGGIFVYNLKTYRTLKKDYIYKVDNDPSNDNLISSEFANFSAESLKANRNIFRQNIDYSVLFFILFWGLNVVDATVDGHLKAFDVSDNLSVYLQPGHSELANTSGLSIVMKIGK